jgi:hypothetical protein
VERVWVVEPKESRILNYRSPSDVFEARGEERLRGEGRLTGFEASVAELMNGETIFLYAYPVVQVRPRMVLE